MTVRMTVREWRWRRQITTCNMCVCASCSSSGAVCSDFKSIMLRTQFVRPHTHIHTLVPWISCNYYSCFLILFLPSLHRRRCCRRHQRIIVPRLTIRGLCGCCFLLRLMLLLLLLWLLNQSSAQSGRIPSCPHDRAWCCGPTPCIRCW